MFSATRKFRSPTPACRLRGVLTVLGAVLIAIPLAPARAIAGDFVGDREAAAAASVRQNQAPRITQVPQRPAAPVARKSTPTPPAASTQIPRVTLTTTNLAFALTTMPIGPFSSTPPAQLPVIRVEDRVHYQRITGFGAAMTDSSAWLIHDQLPPPARVALMNQLFAPSGIHLSFVRVPMGASDFSATGVPYSYDDLPSGETDPQLLHFSVAHDQAYVIPALQLMMQVNPQVQILANPWSPPPWMKANGTFDDLYGRGTLLPEAYGPLADYFVRFLQAYRAFGIPIAAITPQNEPGAGSPYPGLNLPADAQAQFISQNLRPALDAAGLHPSIYGLDRGSVISDARTLLQGPAAGALAGIAWHCYGGPAVMSRLHNEYPSVNQMMTECSPGIVPFTAAEIAISSTRNWASAVALWNLALDPAGGPVQPKNWGCTGCTGLATVSELTHAATLGLNYYQLGQLSKFVQPGAVRIRSDRWVSDFVGPSGAYGVTRGLDNVAFLNPDGSKVLVAYNNSSAAIAFAINWRRHYIAYRLPARATATFTWR